MSYRKQKGVELELLRYKFLCLFVLGFIVGYYVGGF